MTGPERTKPPAEWRLVQVGGTSPTNTFSEERTCSLRAAAVSNKARPVSSTRPGDCRASMHVSPGCTRAPVRSLPTRSARERLRALPQPSWPDGLVPPGQPIDLDAPAARRGFFSAMPGCRAYSRPHGREWPSCQRQAAAAGNGGHDTVQVATLGFDQALAPAGADGGEHVLKERVTDSCVALG
jgi:hypothetical protein